MSGADLAQNSPKDRVTIEDLPIAGQNVLHDGKHFTTVKEGLAHILVPVNSPQSVDPQTVESKTQSVFYNPIQQFNRDLSVLAIRAYGEDLIALHEERAEKSANGIKKHRVGRRNRRPSNAARERNAAKEAEPAISVGSELLSAKVLSSGAEEVSHGLKVEKIPATEERNKGEPSSAKEQIIYDNASRYGNLHQQNGVKRPAEERVDENNESELTTPSTYKRLKVAENPLEACGAEVAQNSGLREQDPLATNGDLTDCSGKSVHVESFRAYSVDGHALAPHSFPSKTTKLPRFKILDALSATGLRALRYAQEIPAATAITANDLSHQATQSIKINVKHNRLEGKIEVVTGNALTHMYSFVGQQEEKRDCRAAKYDVIDLDPYGTAVPFLDAALQALNDGGLLCVTCTDSGVFAAVGYPEKAYALYGGTPIKGLHSHEGGLRLLLHSIATSAARYGIAVEPLLSLSIDFYIRVFVRVTRSPAEVKMLAGKTMLVYSCDAGCGAWQTQYLARNQPQTAKDGKTWYKYSLAQAPTSSPFCQHCGFKTHMSGPMYGGVLHNAAFIEKVLSYLPDLDKNTYATKCRIEGMLTTALEETLIDNNPKDQAAVNQNETKEARPVPRVDPAQIDLHPFYFMPSALAKVIHCQAPPEAVLRGALRHAGYKATRSHARRSTIRTDAPWTFVWEMMREWVRQKAPIKANAIKPGTAGWNIMRNHIDKEAQDHEMMAPQVEDKLNIKEADDNSVDNNVLSPEQVVPISSHGKRFEIVFDEKLGQDVSGKRLVRYQANPRANWGPMNRARCTRS